MMRPLNASLAAKMSWASGRTTTRIEDIAYSLMGLFEVNMPLLYGEGRNAFTRLQHEIVKITDDESIFAWRDNSLVESGAFAPSPRAFRKSGHVINVKFPHLERPPYTVTHRGLAIELSLVTEWTRDMVGEDIFTAALQCAFATDLSDPISIQLMSVNQHDLIRISPHLFMKSKRPHDDPEAHFNKLVYIRPTKSDFFDGINQATTFYVRIGFEMAHGFSISETCNCEPQRVRWDEERDDVYPHSEYWKIEIDLQYDFAALLFKGDQSDHQEAFAIVLITSKSIPQMDIIIPTGSENLTEILENKFSQRDQYTDRLWISLQENSHLFASLRRRDTRCDIEVDISTGLKKNYGSRRHGGLFTTAPGPNTSNP